MSAAVVDAESGRPLQATVTGSGRCRKRTAAETAAVAQTAVLR
jgi:hypothetical protein